MFTHRMQKLNLVNLNETDNNYLKSLYNIIKVLQL